MRVQQIFFDVFRLSFTLGLLLLLRAVSLFLCDGSFISFDWFLYFFFHRLAPLRLDSKADIEEMTRTRVNHKLIHKLVALENILLLAVFVEINIFPLSQMHYRSAFCCSFISPRPRIRRTYLSAVVVHVLAIRKS